MKKKILIFILVLIISLIPVVSSAETLDLVQLIPNDGNSYKVIVYSKYLVGGNYRHEYRLYTSNMPFVIVDNYYNANNKDIAYSTANYYKYQIDKDDDWVFMNTLSNNTTICYSTNTASMYEVKYSNHDLKYEDGTVFFSVPKVSPLLSTAQQIPMRNLLLGSILAGLIPLVGLLILVISFRKGWAFLRRQLTI